MDKLSSEISSDHLIDAGAMPAEKRALSEVMHIAKRSGGNYGSLAKSQLQPTYYICHKVESNDTLQRLALKYSINIQEIKRVNKLWSDAELSLLEIVYIPVNATQLSTLRTLYPTINTVQNISLTTHNHRKSLTNPTSNDEIPPSLPTSNSLISASTAASASSTYQDYFSRIDQQIRSSKQSLQSFDLNNQNSKSSINGTANDNELTSSQNNRATTLNSSGRHKGIHHLTDNSVFVNITTTNSREKHVSAALERIRRERDDLDEL